MPDPIYADFHVHTHLSPCGQPEATAEALIAQAHNKGITTIGFADHITPQPVSDCSFYAQQRPTLLDNLRDEIAHIPNKNGLNILIGIEADYTLAKQDCLDTALLSQLDHVICAASHFHIPGAPKPASNTPRAKAELMLQMAQESLTVPGISVWAHPFDCSKMRPLAPILATITDQELAQLIEQANTHEIAIEINGGALQSGYYRDAIPHFFELVKEMSARITITADAHHPDDFNRLDLALNWARKMGFRDQDFLTTEELKAQHQKRITAISSQQSANSTF
jgi:histidinol phosphatase-like PHP family hydrolase